MKKYKTYNINLISKLSVSSSIKQKLSFWALVNIQWKRVAKEYYHFLMRIGITVISKYLTSDVTSMASTRCSKFNKMGLQCKCKVSASLKIYCFQHSFFILTKLFIEKVKPFFKWVGGKQDSIHILNKKLPTVFNNYHEIFLGGGSVLFSILSLIWQKQILIKGNIFAYDKNEDLINVYCMIQTNPDLLNNYLEFYSEQYLKYKSLDKKKFYYLWIRSKFNNLSLNTIDRAALFIFLNKTGFRGIYRVGPNGFNVPFGNYSNPAIIFNKTALTMLSFFIKDVTFKVTSFESSLGKCATGDFIFMDPPYVQVTPTTFLSYTKDKFSLKKHLELFRLTILLVQKRCSFLMTNADVMLVRDNFKNYTIDSILAKRRINAKTPQSTALELYIRNFI